MPIGTATGRLTCAYTDDGFQNPAEDMTIMWQGCKTFEFSMARTHQIAEEESRQEMAVRNATSEGHTSGEWVIAHWI